MNSQGFQNYPWLFIILLYFQLCRSAPSFRYSLYIIFANVLDNTVEADYNCSDRSKIVIAAQLKQGYWTMTM